MISISKSRPSLGSTPEPAPSRHTQTHVHLPLLQHRPFHESAFHASPLNVFPALHDPNPSFSIILSACSPNVYIFRLPPPSSLGRRGRSPRALVKREPHNGKCYSIIPDGPVPRETRLAFSPATPPRHTFPTGRRSLPLTHLFISVPMFVPD
jgi:hypothetical protein